MAERIEGLSIGLGLDTIGIDKGLSEVKRKLSVVNNEMKANMSAFDKGERSVNKYETQLTGLNKKLDAQKISVRNAKDEYERMVKVHGEGSTQADKAAGVYNREVASLNNLSRHVEGVTEEFKAFQKEQEIAESRFGKLSESMENVGTKMKSIGDGMASAGKQMTIGITAPLAGMAFAANRAFYEVDEGLDNVTMATGATGDELEALQQSFKNVYGSFPTDSATLGDVLGEVNTRFGYTDEQLEESTEKFLKFANITGVDAKTGVQLIARAMGDAGIEADEYGAVLDSVARAAQLTGVGADALAESITKFGAPMRALGFDMDESVALFANWEKAGVNTDIAMSGLKKSISAWGKEGKDPREEFEKTLKAIEAAPDIAEATALSIEAFGSKAGPDLADAIQGGRFEYAGLLEDLRNSEGTVDTTFDDTIDGAEKFQVAMQNIKLVGSDLWGTIEGALGPALENLTGKLQAGVEKFAGLSDATKITGLVFAGIAAAIGPVLVAVGSLISMFGSVMTALAPLSLKIAKAGGLFKYLRVALAAFTGPVGITIAVLTGLGIIFTTLYQKSETFRNAVQAVGGKIKEFAGQVKTAFGAVTALFQGNGVKAGALMRSLGLSEDQIRMVFVTFVQLRSKVQESLSAITGFFSSALSKIKGFWSTEGAQITAAAQNIFNGLKTGAQFLGRVLKATFEGIFAVIKFIMPAVLAVIKMVWGNIKSVITGALDVIMGAVKIFSGLFTGDFSKMWEGVKQVFFGAIRLVWNAIQLTFFGKIAKGAALFVGSFRAVFVKLWQYLIGLFTRSVSSVFSTVARYFNLVLSTTRSIFNAFSTFLRNIFTAVRDSVTRSAGNIFTNVRSAWTKLKNSTTEIFRGIYNGIKTRFTDIVNAAKALPKRIGDGIGSMASKVKGGVTKVINNLATTLGKGINGVITGVNWVLDKIGVGKAGKIDLWTVPQYAQGTKGHHPGGPMVVGDGKGSNAGPELIETPDGKQMLSPAKPTLMNGPKGTKVWSATATRDILDMIPHYAFGDKVRAAGEWAKDNLLDPALSGVKAVGGKVKDVALNVFDYLKNPGGLLDLALETLGIKKPDGGSMVGDMARGGFNKVKSSALGFIKGKLTDFGSSQSGITLTGGNGGGFGAPFRLTSVPGPRNTGIPGASTMHKGWDWAAPVGTPIPSVTDGIGYRTGFHRLSGNFVEVKSGNKIHRYQHNSKNLLKVGQPVKKGQKIALVGATGVGSGPHLHYEVRGLETGGITNKEQLVNISEKNREEITIPMHKSRRSDAMKLMAIAGKKLMSGGKSGGGITRPNQLPNVPANGGNSNNRDNEVIELLKQQVALLMQLVQKNGDVYLDNGALVGGIGDDMNTHLGNSSKNSMYMNGVR